jgi:hypothetical protein
VIPIDLAFIRKLSGRLLGSITGKRKARNPETARKAALVRWSKKREKPLT